MTKPKGAATPRKTRRLASTWAWRLLLLCGIVPARAQSVDYQAMEQMFGEPVTNSVTGKPQRAADAPANVEIITQDDIRRSGATTIPDVLAFVTGVDARNGHAVRVPEALPALGRVPWPSPRKRA